MNELLLSNDDLDALRSATKRVKIPERVGESSLAVTGSETTSLNPQTVRNIAFICGKTWMTKETSPVVLR